MFKSDNKRIWILNHYAGDTFFSKSGRHYNFAKRFKERGLTPFVFCANSLHETEGHYFNNEQLWREQVCESIGVPYVFVKARNYVGNGKKRLMNMADFYRNVKAAAKAIQKSEGTPDVIYASSVHPLTLVAGLQLAKRYKVKCLCEVRDLWPESIVVLHPGIKKHRVLLKALYQGEKWIYKKADALVFTMEGGSRYIEEKGWSKAVNKEKIHYVNNGVDLAAFRKHVKEDVIDDEDLQDRNTFKVVYTGSIRKANGLEQIINCAEVLRDNRHIKFLIYGAGEDLEELKRMCAEREINNVVFKGKVENKYVPFILSNCNLNLLNYSPEVSKVFKYGSSQNKLFEYLASGRPILSDTKIEYSVIDKYHCGYNEDIHSAEEYAQAITQFFEMDQESYDEMCRNAAAAAREYNYENLADKMISIIDSM